MCVKPHGIFFCSKDDIRVIVRHCLVISFYITNIKMAEKMMVIVFQQVYFTDHWINIFHQVFCSGNRHYQQHSEIFMECDAVTAVVHPVWIAINKPAKEYLLVFVTLHFIEQLVHLIFTEMRRAFGDHYNVSPISGTAPLPQASYRQQPVTCIGSVVFS